MRRPPQDPRPDDRANCAPCTDERPDVNRVDRASKTCTACGRRIEWRKKWERNWDDVRYCSAVCRRRGVRPVDYELASAITTLLDELPGGATISPSAAARLVAGRQSSGSDGWRDLTEPTRAAARRLVAEGHLEFVQRGNVVDPSTAKGPILVRRRSAP